MKTRILLPVLFIFGLLVLLLTGCPLNPNWALTVKRGSQVIENTGAYDFGIIDRYNLPVSAGSVYLSEGAFTMEDSTSSRVLEIVIEASDTSALLDEPIFSVYSLNGVKLQSGYIYDFTIGIQDRYLSGATAVDPDFIAPGLKSATVLVTDAATGAELYRFSVTTTISPSKARVEIFVNSSSATTSTYAKAELYSISSSQKKAKLSVPFGFETSMRSLFFDAITNSIAELPMGKYALQVYLDQNNDTYLNSGEKGYTTIVDITGDTVLTVGDPQLSVAVTEVVTATITGGIANGKNLIAIWHYPGTTINALAAINAGPFSGDNASTNVNSVFIPGTYDLYCYADMDNGANLGATPPYWDNDSGEYEYSAQNITVTGAGTAAGTFTPKP